MMKAILRADFLNLKQSARTLGLLIIFFVAIALFTRDVISFAGTFLIMILLIVPFNLFSYDAAYGWDKLTLSLPISRHHVILSKYVLCIGLGASLLLFTSVVSILYCLQNPETELSTQLSILLFCTAVALLLLAIMFPLIVKYGVTKGRYILLAVVWLPIILMLFLKNSNMPNPFTQLNLIEKTGNLLSFALLSFTICCVIYMISALLSIHIYQKKEF